MLLLIGKLIGTAICGFIVVFLFGSLIDLTGNVVEEASWNSKGHLVSHRTRVFLIFLVFLAALLGLVKFAMSIIPT